MRDSAAEVFERADMIVKVKEPQPVETAMLRPGQILYTYLHLAPDPEQTRELVKSGAVCIAYETVTGHNGGPPLLKQMSQVAGRMAGAVCCWAAFRVSDPRGSSGSTRRRWPLDWGPT